MIKTTVTIKGIDYIVRGRTAKDIKVGVKALKTINKKTPKQDGDTSE